MEDVSLYSQLFKPVNLPSLAFALVMNRPSLGNDILIFPPPVDHIHLFQVIPVSDFLQAPKRIENRFIGEPVN